MKTSGHVLPITAFILLQIFLAIGQAPRKHDEKVVVTGQVKQDGNVEYQDWQRIQLNRFSFYLPKGWSQTQKNGKCIEGGCYDFEDGINVLGIDVNADASRPTIERKFASYHESTFWLDKTKGIYVWQWSYKEERYRAPYDYSYGCLFLFEKRKNYVVNFTLLSNSPGMENVATKIFKSVQFNGL